MCAALSTIKGKLEILYARLIQTERETLDRIGLSADYH